jgi:hypothetical protein
LLNERVNKNISITVDKRGNYAAIIDLFTDAVTGDGFAGNRRFRIVFGLSVSDRCPELLLG